MNASFFFFPDIPQSVKKKQMFSLLMDIFPTICYTDATKRGKCLLKMEDTHDGRA